MATNYPLAYVRQNESDIKELNVVVCFEDSICFSLQPTYKRIRYGDPGINYGDPGLVYGGLIPFGDGVRPYLSPNSNLVLSQKLEPEQGRASVQTMTLEFVDVNGFMTQFVSPGQQLDEILGGKQVKIHIGYKNTAFPEDYFVVFRGYVTSTKLAPTKVIVQLSDANSKRRGQVFFSGTTIVRRTQVNFNDTNVNIANDRFDITNHPFVNGQKVQLLNGGTLPAPLTVDTDYWVRDVVPGVSFKLSATDGGGVINITNEGGSAANTFYLVGLGTTGLQVPVFKTEGFHDHILGPDGLNDSTISTYLKIGEELLKYGPGDIGTELFDIVERGSLGTPIQDHEPDAEVSNQVEIRGNILDNSLKIMLSGWNGVWKEDVPVRAFGNTEDPAYGVLPNAIIFPDGVNAKEDYGLAPGEYIYVTGSGSGNDGTYRVLSFLDRAKYPNNIVLVDKPVTLELPTGALLAFRSQYDVYPVSCGSKLRPIDVDIEGWQKARRLFAFQSDNTFANLIREPKSGKEFIEKEYLLPVGAYSVTRFGRLSVVFTKPPVVSTDLVILDNTNVVEPQTMTIERGLNSRRFFNEVQYQYDFDAEGEPANVLSRLDTESLTLTDTSAVLPIKAEGLRTELGADTFIDRRASYVLQRYSKGAVALTLKCNWKAASLMQVADVVGLYDEGNLQIPNLETGLRDFGVQLLEVINWDLDLKTGSASLMLMTQLFYSITDRFGGISPSSNTIAGSTTTAIRIRDSYGAKFPANEREKWNPIVGDTIQIHSKDYSVVEYTRLLGFNPGNPYEMLVNPPLSAPPPADYVVDCAPYPDTTDPNDNFKSKLLFAFIDPTLTVVTGVSDTEFTVSPADAAKAFPDLPVKVHNADYSVESPECIVDSVVGVTITLKTSLGFTPVAGQKVEFVGFKDGGGPFRIL